VTAHLPPQLEQMDDHREQTDRERSWWRSPVGIVTLGFLAVAGYFLITEHAAHIIPFLPWLLLAACPLMHPFMHHGSHSHTSGRPPAPNPEDQP
jgi:hypothetical protein